jgi:hypothetical protein
LARPASIFSSQAQESFLYRKLSIFLETAKVLGKAANLFVERIEFEAGLGDD